MVSFKTLSMKWIYQRQATGSHIIKSAMEVDDER